MSKATLAEVREYIRFASKAELEAVNDIIRSRWKHLQAETAMMFTRGDKVKFIHGKRNPRRISGTVVGTDGKIVYVKSDDYFPQEGTLDRQWNWRCSPVLLTKVV